MSDEKHGEDKAHGGKVIPLNSRDAAGGKSEKGQGNSLPLSGETSKRSPRAQHYFPPQTKEYARWMLRSFKSENSIGDQRLRDRIMAHEDSVGRQRAVVRGEVSGSERWRDPALTKDDLRKWLGTGSTHQIGDAKFFYVNRFLQSLEIEGILESEAAEFHAARREYHLDALRDFFSIRPRLEREHLEIITTAPTILAARIQDASHATVVVFVGELKRGIGSALALFSRDDLGKDLSDYSREEISKLLFEINYDTIFRGAVIFYDQHFEDKPEPNEEFIAMMLMKAKETGFFPAYFERLTVSAQFWVERVSGTAGATAQIRSALIDLNRFFLPRYPAARPFILGDLPWFRSVFLTPELQAVAERLGRGYL